jgi:hypothetical protein
MRNNVCTAWSGLSFPLLGQKSQLADGIKLTIKFGMASYVSASLMYFSLISKNKKEAYVITSLSVCMPLSVFPLINFETFGTFG